MNSESLYEQLEIPRTASGKEIKVAYRRLAMRWHPDRNPENPKLAEQQFKRIKFAYETLSNSEKRRSYDESLNTKQHHGKAHSADTTWTPSPEKGKDAFAKAAISLEQALSGCFLDIQFTTEEYCSECKGDGEITPGYSCLNCQGSGKKAYANGETRCRKCGGSGVAYRSKCKKCRGSGTLKVNHSLKVKLPIGVYDGCLFTIQNKGGKGQFGGSDGSLLLTVRIKQTGKNRIEGSDVIVPTKIDFITAILGGTVKVRTPSGYQEITVPPFTRAGEIIYLTKGGLRSKESSLLGRMGFEIILDLPRKTMNITDQVRETLLGLR